MAKLATLIDDFQDNSINGSLWSTSGTVAETGGRAKLTPTTSFSFWGTATTYDLTNSQVNCHIPVVTSNGSTGSLQCGMVTEASPGNYLGIRKVGSQLVCTKSEFGTETQLSFTPYSGVNHLFWRIRADSSNVYWETSATGSGAYFIQNTAAISSIAFSLTALTFYFYTGYSGVEAFPGTFQIEAVNPGLPITATGSSTSTGSLALQTVSPLSLTANALSTSSGTLALTSTAAPSKYLTFSGASTSTGHLSFNPLAAGSLTFSGASTFSGSLTLSIPSPPAILPGGTWYFEPPIAYDLPPTLPDPKPRYLNAHAKWKGGQRRGRSVLKISEVASATYPAEDLFPSDSLFPSAGVATYVVVDTPTVDQMAAAEFTYQGGHIYTVTAEEAYNLIVAGFTPYHETDLLTTESGDLITTESGDIIEVEYSFGLS